MISGVTLAPGVTLTAGQAAFVRKLRAKVAASVPIKVTSADRDAAEQASAMLKKYQAAEAQGASGSAELRSLYRSSSATIEKLLAAPKTVEAWAAIIRADVASGVRLSRHLTGGALDLHTATLTSSQRSLLVAGVTAMGARALLEGTPPHLHVDLPTAYAAASFAQVAAPWALAGWVIGGVALVAYLARKRRQRKAA